MSLLDRRLMGVVGLKPKTVRHRGFSRLFQLKSTLSPKSHTIYSPVFSVYVLKRLCAPARWFTSGASLPFLRFHSACCLTLYSAWKYTLPVIHAPMALAVFTQQRRSGLPFGCLLAHCQDTNWNSSSASSLLLIIHFLFLSHARAKFSSGFWRSLSAFIGSYSVPLRTPAPGFFELATLLEERKFFLWHLWVLSPSPKSTGVSYFTSKEQTNDALLNSRGAVFASIHLPSSNFLLQPPFL